MPFSPHQGLKSSVSLKKHCRAQGNPNRKSLCCLKLASACRQRLISWCAVWMLRRWGWRLGISSSPCPHLDSWKKAPVCFSTETLGVRKLISSGFSVLTATSSSADLDLCPWAFLWQSNASALSSNYGMTCTPIACFLDLSIFFRFFFQFVELFFKTYTYIYLYPCTLILNCSVVRV